MNAVTEMNIERGMTVKKRFWQAMLIGFLLICILAGGIFFGGVALAVPVGGIGGFTIEFSRIEATEFQLTPKLGESSEQQSIPQGSARLNGKIYDLKLYKDLKIPGGKTVRILITAEKPVEVKGLQLDLSKLNADATFTNLTIKETYSDEWNKKFGLQAPSFVFTNTSITSHYLFTNSITLPGLGLKVETIGNEQE
jgi:hypothetical protein